MLLDGQMEKGRVCDLKGELFRTADGKWLYFEDNFGGSGRGAVTRSICHVDRGGSPLRRAALDLNLRNGAGSPTLAKGISPMLCWVFQQRKYGGR